MATPKNMFIGFMTGLVAGLLVYSLHWEATTTVQWIMEYVTGLIGTMFLRALMMLVMPLVFSALVIGVASMGDAKELATLGLRMAVFTVASTGLAVTMGLLLMHVISPGTSIDPNVSAQLIAMSQDRVHQLMEASHEIPSGMALFTGIVPTNVLGAVVRNDVLAVLFFSLLMGVGIVSTKTPAAKALLQGIEGLFDVTMTLVDWVIWTAPIAIACLVFNSIAVFGWTVLAKLGMFVLAVMIAMLVHACVFYPLMIRFATRFSPIEFLRKSRESLVMAFSTSSSTATLPTTLRVAEEELELPISISRFVVTIGATANQNGTALFEGMTVLFLAQMAGIDLAIGQQVLLMVICVLGGIGTAGVPAGSLPVIAMICVMFGIPPEGLGIVLGVDRFLDMCRTTVNVGGDLVASAVLTQWDERTSS